MNDKDLLYSTGNYTQYFVRSSKGKKSEKGYRNEDIDMLDWPKSSSEFLYHLLEKTNFFLPAQYVYITETLCCISETDTTL